MDLANILHYKMLTPIIKNEHIIQIRYKKLDDKNSFHQDIQDSEKYGINSTFARICKNEESAFLIYYIQALKNIDINNKKRVLNIGVNNGDEFEVIKNYIKNTDIQMVGIDYCKSAIDIAKDRYKDNKNIEFINADINKLDSLNIGRFDLIVSIGTMQSRNINYKTTFMSLVQNYLTNNGSIIMGFVNCRWIDTQMIYGAMMKNYTFSDMSLMIKDIYFAKKYLQQKKFRVFISGKDYIFLSAKRCK
jgi:cyclopropane fatty-acyl-phospholipid synthase-like methyltransferase